MRLNPSIQRTEDCKLHVWSQLILFPVLKTHSVIPFEPFRLEYIPPCVYVELFLLQEENNNSKGTNILIDYEISDIKNIY